MSYDLMVFDPAAAPFDRKEFKAWYDDQTKWSEGHSYNDPKVTTPALQDWFHEMIREFPAMNGPYASTDYDNSYVTDYSVGRAVIYAGFAWSVAQDAYKAVVEGAARHKVGFYDVSGPHGEIVLPGQTPRDTDSATWTREIDKSSIDEFVRKFTHRDEK